jgi:predicted ATPase/DNA-binding winged helix-turn-helix (wHTH) protein
MAAYLFGSCRLDTDSRELLVEGRLVPLEPQVFDVLAYLVANRHRLIPKTELLDAVWGNRFVTDSALTSRIKSARGAIGDDGVAQRLIRTQRGRGYRFVGKVANTSATTTGTPTTTATPSTTGTTAAPGTTEATGTSSTAEAPGTISTAEAPGTTGTTEAPRTTGTTEAPRTTGTTEAPRTTGTAGTTEAPGTTGTTEAPGATGTAGAAGAAIGAGGVASDSVDDGAPHRLPRPRAGGALPAPRFRLVGRVSDLATLDRLLHTHRIVTISGPGGAGKSTLGVETARARSGEPELEVAFVELAPARGGVDVTRAVAEATGVEGAAAADAGMLTANLAQRSLLLVLDNCEHLLDDAAALVHRLLDAGPAVRVLATSREPLGVDGEAVHVLGSLGPDAPVLFAERAAATGRGAVTADDPTVVELCERLDGLPLAIELAAAQTRHLTVAQLVGRTDDRLDLLVAGRPRAGVRHATLARTIEWSYDLLTDTSREAFDALGVFPAGFDLPAVQAVCGLDDVAAANVVGDLVGKSLVGHDPETGRYRLLETIRLFAWQRLESSGRLPECAERLRRHAVGRVTAQPRQRVWLSATTAARSRDDIENVRAAFDGSVAAGRFADAVDLMLGLATLWRNAASYAEGLRWATTLAGCPLEPRDRLWLHILEADLGLGSGDPALMARAAVAAGAVSATVDDPPAAVIVATYRALTAVSRPAEAVAGLTAAAEAARAAGEPVLDRLARAFRAVALLATGRRDDELAAEIDELTSVPSDGYDRYICIYAAWSKAFVDRDGARLRMWMTRQTEHLHGSGLRENWVMLFCDALADIAGGADYLPQLGRALHRAEAEGRNADVDVVLALAYDEACRDRPVQAAELMGTCGGRFFHDTANFLHFLLMRDCVVRPMLDPETFAAATARGQERSLASVLSEHQL